MLGTIDQLSAADLRRAGVRAGVCVCVFSDARSLAYHLLEVHGGPLWKVPKTAVARVRVDVLSLKTILSAADSTYEAGTSTNLDRTPNTYTPM